MHPPVAVITPGGVASDTWVRVYRRRHERDRDRAAGRLGAAGVHPADSEAAAAAKITARRSKLFGYAGYGEETSHSRFYWSARLMLITSVDGTVTGSGLANPKLMGERAQTRKMLTDRPVNVPAPGTVAITDKGLSGNARHPRTRYARW